TPPGPPDTLDPATLQPAGPRASPSTGEEASMTVTAPERSTIEATLRTQRIGLPSWAFGNSGTRFKVFAQAGVPRDPFEKIDDAATAHRFTGAASKVSLHIPW